MPAFPAAERSRTALAGMVLLALAGCAGRAVPPGDAAFVSRMIPHHALGMRLVDEATLHSDGVELRRLVFEMGGYHHDELSRLEKWAADWAVTESATFPGDLPADEVDRLDDLSGPAHDSWWLHLMIEHHRGAVSIATDAVNESGNRDLAAMARSVRTTQAREIESMTSLLAGICASDRLLPGC